MGGYFPQINGWINLTEPADIARVTGMGEIHPHETTFWTGHYPKLSPRDIIVEQMNKRWRVVDVSYTEKRRVIVHQIVRVTEIGRGDIEYQLPVEDIVIPPDPSGFLGFYPESSETPEGSGLL